MQYPCCNSTTIRDILFVEKLNEISMKFSDEFLESFASLFGQEQADSFLVHNLDKYVAPDDSVEPGSNNEDKDEQIPVEEEKDLETDKHVPESNHKKELD